MLSVPLPAVKNGSEPVDLLLVDANPYVPAIQALGLEVLSHHVRRAGFRCKVFSASPFLPGEARRWRALDGLAPAAIGIQIRNYDAGALVWDHPTPERYLMGVRRRLARRFPGVPVVLGGIGFSMDPERWLERLDASHGIVGSGEATIVGWLESVLGGREPERLPGLVARGGGSGGAAPAPPPAVLEGLEGRTIDRGFLGDAAAAFGGMPSVAVEVSRGCPYRCDFCVEPRVHGHAVSHKAPAAVESELRELHAQGVERVFLAASEFNALPEEAVALCEHLAKTLGRTVAWCTYLLPSRTTPRLLAAMGAAGCVSVSLNAVHVDDRVLAGLHCPHRRRHVEAAIRMVREAGLELSVTFLAGSGLETDDSLAALLAFVDERDLRVWLSLGLACYAGLPPGEATSERTRLPSPLAEPSRGVPYALGVGADARDALRTWAKSRANVRLVGVDPELAGDWPGVFPKLLADLESNDEPEAERALKELRRRVPLLDLPEVGLDAESHVPVPPQPSFGLYGPYRRLSLFYRALEHRLARGDSETNARVLLRLSRVRGEFPRIVDFARKWLDAEAADWLSERWRKSHELPQLVFATSYECQARCPYCYAKDVDRSFPGSMTEADFLTGLNWAERQGCRVISFVGGEPTLHPLMQRFLSHVRRRAMHTYFNSNLQCDPSLLEPFDGSWVLNIGIHAQAERYTPRSKRGPVQANARLLAERNVPLFLRYNFDRPSEDAIEDAIRTAHALNVDQVNFSIPMPSLSRRNRHATERELLGSGAFLVRIAERLRAEGLRPVLTKPIPPCAVPEDKLSALVPGEDFSPACNLPQRGWTQNLLVGPDLRVSPCVGITSRGPRLDELPDLEAASRYMIEHLSSIVRSPPFEKCRTCNFFVDQRCLGGCLAYFTDGEQPTAPSDLVRLGRKPVDAAPPRAGSRA